jgi:acyl carrier protein
MRAVTNPDALTAKIRSIVAQYGKVTLDFASAPDTADLYAAGLTSQASVGLMLALEGEFDVEFPDQLLNRRTFESVAAIRGVIAKLVGDKA